MSNVMSNVNVNVNLNECEVVEALKEGNMKYFKAVKRLRNTTVEALIKDLEFRESFSLLVKAKDKKAFMVAVCAVHKQNSVYEGDITAKLISLLSAENGLEKVEPEEDIMSECNQIVNEDLVNQYIDSQEYYEYSEEEDMLLDCLFNSEINEELVLSKEQATGLVKYEFSEEQKAYQASLSFVEKTINYGRILYGIKTHGQTEAYADNMCPWSPILRLLESFITKDLSDKPKVMAAYSVSKENDVLCEAFKKAGAFLKGEGLQFIRSAPLRSRVDVYAKYTSNGFIVDVNNTSLYAVKYGVQSQHTLRVTGETFSISNREALSKILLCHAFYTGKHMTLNNELDNFPGMEYIPLFDIIYLAKVGRVDMKSLLVDKANHIILSNTEVVEEDRSKRLTPVSKAGNPIDIVLERGLENYFGPSSPDTLKEGVLKANKSYDGFADYNGDYVSFEKTANKLVARTMKLVKDTKHTLVLGKVWCVVDCKGNDQVIQALSTGQILVPTSVSKKHGQVRAVSSADKGGFKCTTSPIALLDKKLEAEGITLASFGSMKAKGYGVRKLLGLSLNAPLKEYIKTVSISGKEVDVIEIEGVSLNITNNYTVQQYTSTNRDKLILSLAEADKAVFDRALSKASVIKEDEVFVDFILEQRDTLFGGDLRATITALLKSGDIKKKTKSVSITSSEFGIMTTTHGESYADAWMDSLVVENTSSSKKEDMFRAIRLITDDYKKDVARTITISSAQFSMDIYNMMRQNGIDPNQELGGFVSRNFLVDLANYFNSDYEGYKYFWLRVTHSLNKEKTKSIDIYLPLGEFIYGDFHKNSTVFEHKVQITGLLGSLLKQMLYITKFLSEKLPSNPGKELTYISGFAKAFGQFVWNMKNEMQGYMLGKKLGKLEAKGTTGVLSVAHWEKSLHTVYSMAKRYYKDLDNHGAVLVKHPELFRESITGVDVKAFFPKRLLKGLTKDQLMTISFAFESTVFISETMALALQNDADGDLVRVSYHKDFNLPMFTGQTLNPNSFSYKFHKEYLDDERAFTNGGTSISKEFIYTNKEVLEGVRSAANAKAGVALYTSLSQKFERFSSVAGTDKKDPKYISTHLLFNTMVQYFSMNAIKHLDNSGNVERSLPEYFLLTNFDINDRDEYAPKFRAFLQEIGGNLSETGFCSVEEWLSYIENALTFMSEFFAGGNDDAAYLLLGKDFRIGQETLRAASMACLAESRTAYGKIVARYMSVLGKAL